MDLNPKLSKPVLAFAFGLLAAFFMPWVQVFGAGMSGYNLGQLGSYGNYAWVIPILSGATILLSFTGVDNRGIGAIAGIVPLGAILYGLIRIGGEGGRDAANGVIEMAGQILVIGAWLTIIFSIAIIIAAGRTLTVEVVVDDWVPTVVEYVLWFTLFGGGTYVGLVLFVGGPNIGGSTTAQILVARRRLGAGCRRDRWPCPPAQVRQVVARRRA